MNGGHFKLGLFVSVAVLLLVAFLFTLGVLERFKPQVTAETYFGESIEGLQPGAAVRFRGVQIGTTDWVGFAAARYPEAAAATGAGIDRSYVMVRLKLYKDALLDVGGDDLRGRIEASVGLGLRARLASSGLGGPTYLALELLDPEKFPAADVRWMPEHIYIPSATSTVVSIVESLASILRQVDELDVIRDVSQVAGDLTRVIEQVEQSDVLAQSSATLDELRGASAEVRALLGDPRLDQIIDDASATLEGARTLLEGDHEELETLVGDMTTMAGSLEQAGVALDGLVKTVNESELITQMQELANDLGPAGRDLSEMANRLDGLVRGNERQIADAVRALRDAALELQAMLEELKANPGRILADPPPKRTPGGGS